MTQDDAKQIEIEFAAAAIAREGFPRRGETALDYRMRLAAAAIAGAAKGRDIARIIIDAENTIRRDKKPLEECRA